MSKIETRILYIIHFSMIGLFSLFILSMTALHILSEDQEFSFSERRSLAELPIIDLNLVKDADISAVVEKYLVDHFPSRDYFRSIQAGVELFLLHRSDIDGIYSFEGTLFKTEYPLRENKIEQAAELIELLSSTSLRYLNSFYSVIPDKSYYLPDSIDHPQLNQTRIEELMNKTIEDSTMLKLSSELSVDYYYKTDLHWDQLRLPEIASFLAGKMKNNSLGELPNYEVYQYGPFYGSWHGRWVIDHEPDTLSWLSNNLLDSAEVYDHYDKRIKNIYELEALGRSDAYDLFLNGARPLLTITADREASESPNKLYLFRDSFGSSLAPLMLAYYDEIVLIDLRYVSAAALEELIDFTPGADALFLFSSMTLNNSDMLKR